jgi:hypothetical protein
MIDAAGYRETQQVRMFKALCMTAYFGAIELLLAVWQSFQEVRPAMIVVAIAAIISSGISIASSPMLDPTGIAKRRAYLQETLQRRKP